MVEPVYSRDGIEVWHGDCREVVPALGETFSAVCTDPPYGLNFMGRDWDHGVPGEHFWQIIRDAMLPGAHLAAFGGTRTQHRLTCAIEDAGMEIRDCLMWMFGSGFPKSHNLKDDWQGWGTALKPAYEPIILARRPLSGTVAATVLQHGTGALNIDASRVGHRDAADLATSQAKNPGRTDTVTSGVYGADRPQQSVNTAGRWPPNVLLDPDAAALLDQMSEGTRASKPSNTGTRFRGDGAMFPVTNDEPKRHDGSGASRFFPVLPIDDPDTLRFTYQAKASRRERNAGLDGLPEKDAAERHAFSGLPDQRMSHEQARNPSANHHPTVKPLALMRWLLTLVTPPGGVVLDPFAGSGSTGVAAAALGIPCVLIEQEAEYLPIIIGRIDHALDERAAGKRWGNGTDPSRALSPNDPNRRDNTSGRYTPNQVYGKESRPDRPPTLQDKGRWPANVLMDREAAALLDQMSGERKAGVAVKRNGVTGTDGTRTYGKGVGEFPVGTPDVGYGDTGGASRFMVVLDDGEPEPDGAPAPRQLGFMTGDD